MAGGGSRPKLDAMLCVAMVSCFRLFWLVVRYAATWILPTAPSFEFSADSSGSRDGGFGGTVVGAAGGDPCRAGYTAKTTTAANKAPAATYIGPLCRVNRRATRAMGPRGRADTGSPRRHAARSSATAPTAA